VKIADQPDESEQVQEDGNVFIRTLPQEKHSEPLGLSRSPRGSVTGLVEGLIRPEMEPAEEMQIKFGIVK
jgi:hypothetical protein